MANVGNDMGYTAYIIIYIMIFLGNIIWYEIFMIWYMRYRLSYHIAYIMIWAINITLGVALFLALLCKVFIRLIATLTSISLKNPSIIIIRYYDNIIFDNKSLLLSAPQPNNINHIMVSSYVGQHICHFNQKRPVVSQERLYLLIQKTLPNILLRPSNIQLDLITILVGN